MVLRHAHDRHFVFLLPLSDDLGFALAAEHHEGRRAVRMDEIAFLLGQHRYELFVVRHHGVKFVRGAALDVEEQRNEANAFGQQPADLLGHAGPHGRIDHADDTAPTGERHEGTFRCLARDAVLALSVALRAVLLDERDHRRHRFDRIGIERMFVDEGVARAFEQQQID